MEPKPGSWSYLTRINILPIAGILLVLLLIFEFFNFSQYQTSRYGYIVTLAPKVNYSLLAASKYSANTTFVTIDQQHIFVNDQVVTLANLTAVMKNRFEHLATTDRAVYVTASKDIAYGSVIDNIKAASPLKIIINDEDITNIKAKKIQRRGIDNFD